MKIKITIETRTGILKPNRTVIKVRHIFISKAKYKPMLNDIDRAIKMHARGMF